MPSYLMVAWVGTLHTIGDFLLLDHRDHAPQKPEIFIVQLDKSGRRSMTKATGSPEVCVQFDGS